MGVGQLIRNVVSAETILTTLNAATGTISASVLPSYVDDVLNFANLAAFPVAGETGKIYVTEDTNKVYRWSGSVYVEISSSATAGEALKLTNARTISTTGDATYSVSFDGSANVSSAITLATVNSNVGAFGGAGSIPVVTVNGKGQITAVSTNSIGNELIAIQALADTAGFLKKTGDGNYSIDNNNYLPLSGGTVTGDLVSTSATASASTTTGAIRAASLGITGAIFAGSLNGNGSGLTSLNASNISTGTLSAARLPTSYLPLAGGTVTGVTNFSNATPSTSTTTGGVVVLGGVGVGGAVFANTVNAASKITVGQHFSISSISDYSNISLGSSFSSEYGASSIEIPTNTLYGGAFGNHTGAKLVCGEMVGWGTAKFKIHTSTNWKTYNPIACFSVGNAGGTFLGSATATSFFVGTNQVVSSRKTGWSAPTGTATRTTFATSTVTLSQLAETVKALIDDLTTHGLIGS